LIQSDWDHPGVANTFGWDIKSVQRWRRDGEEKQADFCWDAECGVFGCNDCGRAFYPIEVERSDEGGHPFECPECMGEVVKIHFKPCNHSGTDGTIDCKECGLKAIDFINSAGEWLRNNDGAKAEDLGYFQ
jgi:DNA-directed RNA polymerase subunit RPC12/RpoP